MRLTMCKGSSNDSNFESAGFDNSINLAAGSDVQYGSGMPLTPDAGGHANVAPID